MGSVMWGAPFVGIPVVMRVAYAKHAFWGLTCVILRAQIATAKHAFWGLICVMLTAQI